MAATGVGLRVLQCWAIPILGPWAGTGPCEFLPRQGGAGAQFRLYWAPPLTHSQSAVQVFVFPDTNGN